MKKHSHMIHIYVVCVRVQVSAKYKNILYFLEFKRVHRKEELECGNLYWNEWHCAIQRCKWQSTKHVSLAQTSKNSGSENLLQNCRDR